jgi:1,4-alpha-glucan branching enzyme
MISKIKNVIVVLILIKASILNAQVISYSPQFPVATDTITITFNANQGNMALNNFNGDVWAHIGVIDNYSSSASDWRYLKGRWSVPDSSTLCQSLGNNQFRLKFKINNYFGTGSQKIRAIAMVFRNTAGNLVGKNADNSDLYIPIYGAANAQAGTGSQGLKAVITSPYESIKISSTNQTFPFTVKCNQTASIIKLYRGNTLLLSQFNTNTISTNIVANTPGKFWLRYEATVNGITIKDSCFYIRNPFNFTENPPSGTRQGITYLSSTSVRLCLLSPWHDNVYVIGQFNNWEIKPEYMMKRAQDGETYWLDVNGIEPGVETAFQYVIDGGIRTGDPYSNKIIDPNNDLGISPQKYPNLLPAFPFGKTQGICSVLQTNEPEYQWQVTNFQHADTRDMLMYELLVRDYTIRQDFRTAKDSIPHLKKMGINCVKIMPWTEFDGNNGWGYGPTYFTAVDKYYGPRVRLKELIDAYHANGMAVILDIVFNHCFGPSPFAQMWWNASERRPAQSNPFCNPIAKHPYNVGYDMNHESPYVKNMMDSVLSFWRTEYKVDGFRFDLSKGFTQFDSGEDIGAWTNYDQSRVNILKRVSSRLWEKHPGTIIIFEHLGSNDEETVLANHGIMLWSKASYQLGQTARGWQDGSDFEWPLSYKAKNWAYHNCIGYGESHDEERLMYENYTHGNVTADSTYNTKITNTALQRMELISPFLILTPGPKMMWMFGELGYDFSISVNGRTGPKPVRWDYKLNPNRHHLYKTYAALNKLKNSYSAFRTSDFDLSAWGKQKQLYVTNNGGQYSNNIDQMNCLVIGNADVVAQDVYTGFQHGGLWYDYITGQSLQVDNTQMNINLQAGEFKVFTDHPLPVPDMSVPAPPDNSGIVKITNTQLYNAYCFPNPAHDKITIGYTLKQTENIEITVFDIYGKKITTLFEGNQVVGNNNVEWTVPQSIENGCYFYEVKSKNGIASGKFIINR